MAVPQEDARTKTVSQGAIDAIRKMGMSAAIKKYTAGEGGAEFKTAVERYYSPQRLKAASTAATKGQVAKPAPAAPSAPKAGPPAPVSKSSGSVDFATQGKVKPPSQDAVQRAINFRKNQA